MPRQPRNFLFTNRNGEGQRLSTRQSRLDEFDRILRKLQIDARRIERIALTSEDGLMFTRADNLNLERIHVVREAVRVL